MSSSYDQYFKAARKEADKQRQTSTPKASAAKAKQNSSQKARARKESKRFSWGGLGAMASGLALAVLGLLYIEEVDKFISRIDVGLFGSALAEEKKDSASGENAAKSAATGKSGEVASKERADAYSQEELKFLNKLHERKRQLDDREKELKSLEAELQVKRAEVEQKIQQLKTVREDIAKVLEQKTIHDDEKIAKLVEFYSSMKPQNAAKIFSDINEDLAVEVLSRMKKKDAANIMNLLAPDKAQRLSEQFAGYRQAQLSQ